MLSWETATLAQGSSLQFPEAPGLDAQSGKSQKRQKGIKKKSSGHPPYSQACKSVLKVQVAMDTGADPQTLTLVCIQGVKLSSHVTRVLPRTSPLPVYVAGTLRR